MLLLINLSYFKLRTQLSNVRAVTPPPPPVDKDVLRSFWKYLAAKKKIQTQVLMSLQKFQAELQRRATSNLIPSPFPSIAKRAHVWSKVADPASSSWHVIACEGLWPLNLLMTPWPDSNTVQHDCLYCCGTDWMSEVYKWHPYYKILQVSGKTHSP